MNEDNGFRGKKGANIFFLVICVCAIAVVIHAGYVSGTQNTRLEVKSPDSFTQGWVARTETGDKKLEIVSREAADAVGDTLTIHNTLPKNLQTDDTLCLQTKNEIVTAFVDGEQIYYYGKKDQEVYGFGVGAVWNTIPLSKDYSGKTIKLKLTPIGERTGLAPYSIMLGSNNSVVASLIWDKIGLICISIILLVISIAALLVAFSRTRVKNGESKAILFFALFVFLGAIWMSSDSDLWQFMIGDMGISYMMFGVSFYLLFLPFALFMAEIIPKHAKLFYAVACFGGAYALVRIALFTAGVIDFEKGLYWLHILMAALIILSNVALWYPVVKTKKIRLAGESIAISVFTVTEAVALCDFYINDKLDMYRSGYASGFYIGIILFVAITIVGALRYNRKMKEQAIRADFFEQRAYTDELTGLLNSKGFDDKVAEILRTLPHDRCCAIVDMDVNYFSQFNARRGLDEGNKLLVRIAKEIRDSCGSGELCARLEADHFTCFLQGNDIDEIMDRLKDRAAQARERINEEMLLMSYGVTEVKDYSQTVTALRNEALLAKRSIKGNYETYIALYDRKTHEKQLREIEILSSFEAALDNKEYVIYLQPKIDTASEEVAGAEALVRKIEPNGSTVSAGEIIEILERKGFVAKLDYYILELVCIMLKRLIDDDMKPFPISSNFSKVHIYDPEFVDKVTEIVDRYELPHRLIEIEITESVFLMDTAKLKATVDRLHAGGFTVSLDDFGGGYSSLNMLKDVSVDTIKMDKKFLENLTENSRSMKIIMHTLIMAQDLGIKTVAEGVETKEQLDFFRAAGCDLIQGFYYSRPLCEEDFIEKYVRR